MITHFTMNYNNNIRNWLTELWETNWLKNNRNQSTFLTRKGNSISITLPLNSATPLQKENLNKKVNKTIIKTTEEHKMVKGQIDTKILKIEAESEVLVKKEQITKELQKQVAKTESWESRNQHSNKKNMHKFRKLNCPSKQQKNKTTFDVVVVEPIRNEDTEETWQSQTVIVPDTNEADGDQQSNGEDASK